LGKEKSAMKRKAICFFAAGFAGLFSAMGYAGGWVIVTFRDVPEYAVAGKPLQLTFIVRRIDGSPMDALMPNVAAESGTKLIKASAVPTRRPGEYAGSLILPRPGKWTIRANAFIDSTRWESSQIPDLTVIAPGSPVPPPLSPAILGKRLFNAKGCVGCHNLIRSRKLNIEQELSDDPGADLFGKRFPEEYLKMLLANPRTTLGLASKPETGDMPNLELTQSEIESLSTFINSERLR